MKKVIRNNVFETNSSSMHSISFNGTNTIIVPQYPLDFVCDEFGWEIEQYTDAQSKLSYVLTAVQYHVNRPEYVSKPEGMSWEDWNEDIRNIKYEEECNRVTIESHWVQWIKDVLNDVGCKFEPDGLEVSSDKYSRFGYIDHQSQDVLDELWSDDEIKFKDNMKNFIFNPNWQLNTDNDNH
jgi:hypothetical protein